MEVHQEVTSFDETTETAERFIYHNSVINVGRGRLVAMAADCRSAYVSSTLTPGSILWVYLLISDFLKGPVFVTSIAEEQAGTFE